MNYCFEQQMWEATKRLIFPFTAKITVWRNEGPQNVLTFTLDDDSTIAKVDLDSFRDSTMYQLSHDVFEEARRQFEQSHVPLSENIVLGSE